MIAGAVVDMAPFPTACDISTALLPAWLAIFLIMEAFEKLRAWVRS